VAADGRAHLAGRHPALAIQLHEGVRRPAEARGVDLGAVALEDPIGLEAVDPPLDGRGTQGDVRADALEGAARVLPQERNDSLIDVVDLPLNCCSLATNRVLSKVRDSAIMNP